MTDEQFEIVQQLLDTIIALLLLNLPEDKAGKNLILALSKSGLPIKDIARLLGLTVNAVGKTIRRANKD